MGQTDQRSMKQRLAQKRPSLTQTTIESSAKFVKLSNDRSASYEEDEEFQATAFRGPSQGPSQYSTPERLTQRPPLSYTPTTGPSAKSAEGIVDSDDEELENEEEYQVTDFRGPNPTTYLVQSPRPASKSESPLRQRRETEQRCDNQLQEQLGEDQMFEALLEIQSFVKRTSFRLENLLEEIDDLEGMERSMDTSTAEWLFVEFQQMMEKVTKYGKCFREVMNNISTYTDEALKTEFSQRGQKLACYLEDLGLEIDIAWDKLKLPAESYELLRKLEKEGRNDPNYKVLFEIESYLLRTDRLFYDTELAIKQNKLKEEEIEECKAEIADVMKTATDERIRLKNLKLSPGVLSLLGQRKTALEDIFKRFFPRLERAIEELCKRLGMTEESIVGYLAYMKGALDDLNYQVIINVDKSFEAIQSEVESISSEINRGNLCSQRIDQLQEELVNHVEELQENENCLQDSSFLSGDHKDLYQRARKLILPKLRNLITSIKAMQSGLGGDQSRYVEQSPAKTNPIDEKNKSPARKSPIQKLIRAFSSKKSPANASQAKSRVKGNSVKQSPAQCSSESSTKTTYTASGASASFTKTSTNASSTKPNALINQQSPANANSAKGSAAVNPANSANVSAVSPASSSKQKPVASCAHSREIQPNGSRKTDRSPVKKLVQMYQSSTAASPDRSSQSPTKSPTPVSPVKKLVQMYQGPKSANRTKQMADHPVSGSNDKKSPIMKFVSFFGSPTKASLAVQNRSQATQMPNANPTNTTEVPDITKSLAKKLQKSLKRSDKTNPAKITASPTNASDMKNALDVSRDDTSPTKVCKKPQASVLGTIAKRSPLKGLFKSKKSSKNKGQNSGGEIPESDDNSIVSGYAVRALDFIKHHPSSMSDGPSFALNVPSLTHPERLDAMEAQFAQGLTPPVNTDEGITAAGVFLRCLENMHHPVLPQNVWSITTTQLNKNNIRRFLVSSGFQQLKEIMELLTQFIGNDQETILKNSEVLTPYLTHQNQSQMAKQCVKYMLENFNEVFC